MPAVSAGDRFGRLVAVECVGISVHRRYLWECSCDCGGRKVAASNALRAGSCQSCGCINRELMSRRLIDLTGHRFGRLVVLCRKFKRKNRWFWHCQCDCGGEANVSGDQLRAGGTRSCGCIIVEATIARSTKHGHARRSKLTKTYRAWIHLIERCRNPNDKAYADYGGRGISVCARWGDSYQCFLADMGDAPIGMSIDRIDVNGNYEPGNCRWATPREQLLNRRMTRRVLAGDQSVPLAELAAKNGISAQNAARRVMRGWDPIAAGTVPLRNNGSPGAKRT